MQAAGQIQLLTQVVIPLLTIAGSGIVSAFITHRLSATKADREFRLRRLEETFIALDGFSKHYTVEMLGYVPEIAGKMTKEEGKALRASHVDPTSGDKILTVEMLIRIYFPELRVRLEALLHERDFIGHEIFSPFINGKVPEQARPELARKLGTAVNNFNIASKQLKEGIFEQAEKIRRVGVVAKLRRFVYQQMDF
jgi:hypothetical protein